MNRAKATLSGVAAGAMIMYFCDPDRGKRRRSLALDGSVKCWHNFSALLDKARRDLKNRVTGAANGITAAFASHDASGAVLIQRVRSRIGRVVSHPHAVEVTAEDGRIVLSGPVFEAEALRLVRAAKSVPGVKEVVDKLEVHKVPDIAGLQGGRMRESRSELMQQNWTPALRIAMGGLGGALLANGIRRGGAKGLACGITGTALLARSVANREFRDIVGIGDGAHAVDFEKAIHIKAPVKQVFAFWSDYQKFPLFMTHLKEVRDLGNGRSHWVAQGPAGVPVSWEAEITQCVPDKLIAWRSIPGSSVVTEGVARFDENSGGGTRIGIRMCYKPPAGVLGHIVASLFGADPKREMDEDLVRLKSLVELGHTHAHGLKVTRDDLTGGAFRDRPV